MIKLYAWITFECSRIIEWARWWMGQGVVWWWYEGCRRTGSENSGWQSMCSLFPNLLWFTSFTDVLVCVLCLIDAFLYQTLVSLVEIRPGDYRIPPWLHIAQCLCAVGQNITSNLFPRPWTGFDFSNHQLNYIVFIPYTKRKITLVIVVGCRINHL